MNREEREKRSAKALIEGNKTEEGRLKIKDIEKYRYDADNDLLNVKFFLIVSGAEALLITLNTLFVKNIYIKSAINTLFGLCGVVNIGRAIYFTKKMFEDKKLADKIETEILDSPVK